VVSEFDGVLGGEPLQLTRIVSVSASITVRLEHLLMLGPPISREKAILSIVLGPLKGLKVFVRAQLAYGIHCRR
jgi:hypothetical protein